jgi:hypothetical protein
MQPAVPPPPGVLRPVTVTLKPGWAFDGKARRFRGPKGAVFAPEGLPEGTRIEPTVPALAGKAPESLSAPERDLQRYLHVVLPAGHAPEAFVPAIRRWPCAASADAGPAVSLPAPGPKPTRRKP